MCVREVKNHSCNNTSMLRYTFREHKGICHVSTIVHESIEEEKEPFADDLQNILA